MDIEEKQGGSLKKEEKKILVEQCKLCLKIQPATHAVQSVLWVCSQQTALPLSVCPIQSQLSSQDTVLLPVSQGYVLLLHELLPDSGPVNSQYFLPLVSTSYSWGCIHTAGSPSLSTAPQLQRLWKDLSSVLLSVPTRRNCLYYNQFHHEKWHFWRWLLSHHLPLCFLTLKQGK